MKIISLDECNEAIKGYFKSLIDKGQQDVDVVDASAELIDVINEIPPAGVLIDMPSENDTFFEDFNNAYRKADVPEMQKQIISVAEDEERFNAAYKESVKMVMLMINEIEQYQAIGTVEECRAAVDKQVAKKPSYEGDGYYNGELVYDTWICPCCEKHYEVDYEEYDFCPNCGQKIDWKADGDNDEEDD